MIKMGTQKDADINVITYNENIKKTSNQQERLLVMCYCRLWFCNNYRANRNTWKAVHFHILQLSQHASQSSPSFLFWGRSMHLVLQVFFIIRWYWGKFKVSLHVKQSEEKQITEKHLRECFKDKCNDPCSHHTSLVFHLNEHIAGGWRKFKRTSQIYNLLPLRLTD